MRAKLEIQSITPYKDDAGNVINEGLSFCGVCKSERYPEDGLDEDNTFAKFSPSVSLSINIANPALIGKFVVGERYYVDFSPAPAK